MILELRAQIRRGGLRGAELVEWLATHPAGERDAAFEELLGIETVPSQRPLGKGRIGYAPSGIAAIVRTILDTPVGPNDVFVDLGSGLGKVTMAVHLLTGARTRGIELQGELAARARERAHDLTLDMSFIDGDALDADLGDGTVFFLYLPFTGEVLGRVMERLEAIARVRPIVVCALGLDLRDWDWLVERPTQEFWLAIYDSRSPGVESRAVVPQPPWTALGEGIALER